MTSSFEFPAYPVHRVSDAERDRALGHLRDGAADGRLSHDTFVRRMELALVARRSEDLAVLTADLDTRLRGATESPLTRRLFGWVGRVSAVSVGIRRAWAAEKLPRLLLPQPGTVGEVLSIGRDPGSGLRLGHETVSRHHAELRPQNGQWVLRDLGSTNGTTVNGQRVGGAAVVRVGDQVGFGSMNYRLSAQ
ncbi:DUF1707 and FHA domain-containing protein [Streptomyces sp. G-G2]|uniref:DUF1707 and FHA domain-containing protein n=1 Tax=Streptomyces sp. G-G2 TaxID=3046201 RepID=UPI0024B9CB63|nr:DUF1707 and FHA domain-containing protein [Streptomyces sp. G-G2]MDJ0380275.1 DUF1707 and FHA domain-containing protein [Streptomyces sp. G-G2]